jgi:uncharacterized protein (DUF427 family)
MDAFHEEAERILGHAADPYRRIDIRRSSRHLVVRDGDEVVADTDAPLALEPVEGQTFCPYKALAA